MHNKEPVRVVQVHVIKRKDNLGANNFKFAKFAKVFSYLHHGFTLYSSRGNILPTKTQMSTLLHLIIPFAQSQHIRT